MRVNEETNHTHASLDSKNYGHCAKKNNLPSPDLSQFVRQISQLWKISELPNLQLPKFFRDSSE